MSGATGGRSWQTATRRGQTSSARRGGEGVGHCAGVGARSTSTRDGSDRISRGRGWTGATLGYSTQGLDASGRSKGTVRRGADASDGPVRGLARKLGSREGLKCAAFSCPEEQCATLRPAIGGSGGKRLIQGPLVVGSETVSDLKKPGVVNQGRLQLENGCCGTDAKHQAEVGGARHGIYKAKRWHVVNFNRAAAARVAEHMINDGSKCSAKVARDGWLGGRLLKEAMLDYPTWVPNN